MSGRLIIITIICIGLMLDVIDARHVVTGRVPQLIDHTLCKVQMFPKLDKIQEMEDPRAAVEAYFNRTGYVCKTYCKIKSANTELSKISAIFDSPLYILCATERYCAKGGKCKRFSSPLPVEEENTSVKDSPQTQQTSQTPQTTQTPQTPQTPQTTQIPQTPQNPQTIPTPQTPQTPQTLQTPQTTQTLPIPQTPQTAQPIKDTQVVAKSANKSPQATTGTFEDDSS